MNTVPCVVVMSSVMPRARQVNDCSPNFSFLTMRTPSATRTTNKLAEYYEKIVFWAVRGKYLSLLPPAADRPIIAIDEEEGRMIERETPGDSASEKPQGPAYGIFGDG